VVHEAVYEICNLGDEPLIFDSVPHTMPPTRIRVISLQEGTLWGPPAVTNAMHYLRL